MIITGRIPAERHRPIARLASSRGGSIIPTSPTCTSPRSAWSVSRSTDSSAPSGRHASDNTRSAWSASPSATARISRRRTAPSGTSAPSTRSATQQGSTASVAPFVSSIRRPSASFTTTLIRLRSESKGISNTTGSAGSSREMPPLSAATTSAPSVGSPTTCQAAPVPPGRTSALLQRAAISSSRARSGSAATRVAAASGASAAASTLMNSPWGA